MKRFLILFILIVFVTMSCAGQKKWTKPDFRQDQFEKDRQDCIQAVKDDPEQKMTVEECLDKKGYEPRPHPDEPLAFKIAGTVLEYIFVGVLIVSAAFLSGGQAIPYFFE